ncbi:MAG: zf-HC2 domain-containing protein, partial [Armatimonadota bacterium]
MSTLRDCSSMRGLLGAYVDGELDDATAWSVEKHCATCAVCSR